MHKAVIAVLIALSASLPAAAATPLSSLQYLVGTWHCTFQSGTMNVPYTATWSNDLNGNALREVTSFGSTGDEELLGYDSDRHQWTVLVLDQRGGATVMRATGDNSNHIEYHSVYPDASISPTFDRVSDTKYATHATFSAGGKTTASVDSCVKVAK